ncbi:MAG: DUF2007 domain-containing protein [Chloroflexi bacterium]|nr:DUF2007 domain-containing protein [Chloroflexota bacterium]
MKKVFSSEDGLTVTHLRTILEGEGIACLTKNEDALTSTWAPVVMDVWPEIWVIDDSQYERAKQIVDEVISAEIPKGPPWKCPRCGEEHEPQFTECWNCGASRPEASS